MITNNFDGKGELMTRNYTFLLLQWVLEYNNLMNFIFRKSRMFFKVVFYYVS